MKKLSLTKILSILSIGLLAPLVSYGQDAPVDCPQDGTGPLYQNAEDCPADGSGPQYGERQRMGAMQKGARRGAMQNEEVAAAMEQFRENRQLFRQEMAQLREQLATCTDDEREAIKTQIREQLRTFREEQRELRREIQRELRAMRQERSVAP